MNRLVERVRIIDRIDREHAGVAHATLSRARDRFRRGVDADYVEPTLLKMQTNATTAAPDIQNPTTNKSHRAPFVGIVPFPERGNEIARIECHDITIASLDDLHRTLARAHVGEQSPVHVA